MTSIADLNAIASVVVDTGLDASPAYPVLTHTETTRLVGSEGEDRISYRERVWRLGCAAEAANLASLATLRTTLETSLGKRGKRVTLSAWAQTRTLAGSADSGGVKGYPTVEVELVPEGSAGTWQRFTLVCTGREAIADGDSLIVDERETTTSVDSEGFETVQVRGRLRHASTSAKGYVETNILAAASSAAATAGNLFSSRITVGLDALECTWEYTVAERTNGANPGSSITRSEVTDETRRSDEGRIVRTVAGFAEGSGSTTFATGQKPTPGANDLLVADRVTQPSGDNDRVSFSYELLKGITPGDDFGALVLYSFREDIEVDEPSRPIQAASFPGRNPVLYRGAATPWVCRVSTEFEYKSTGATQDNLAVAAIVVPSGLSADNRSFAVSPRISTVRPGVKRIRAVQEFIYATTQTRPTAREVGGLS